MSLFNDMIPEVKELLLADRKKYPTRHEGIMKDLNESFLISDISVNTAMSLVEYFNHTDVEPESDSFVIKLFNAFGK